MNRISAVVLLLALLAISQGCRFESEKYWGMPASFGLYSAMEKGEMPDGWGYLYPITAMFDIVLLPFTTLHDLIVLMFDPPSRFTWEEDRAARQMLYGY